jgi:hypothetical protein
MQDNDPVSTISDIKPENVEPLIKSFTQQLDMLNNVFSSKPETPVEPTFSNYTLLLVVGSIVLYLVTIALVYFYPPKIVQTNKKTDLKKYGMFNVLLLVIFSMVFGGVYLFMNF